MKENIFALVPSGPKFPPGPAVASCPLRGLETSCTPPESSLPVLQSGLFPGEDSKETAWAPEGCQGQLWEVLVGDKSAPLPSHFIPETWSPLLQSNMTGLLSGGLRNHRQHLAKP